MTDLSANEMVSYANAMSERIVELERENERLFDIARELFYRARYNPETFAEYIRDAGVKVKELDDVAK